MIRKAVLWRCVPDEGFGEFRRPTTMDGSAAEIAGNVDATRLRDAIVDLVRIPSPPGRERAVAERYAEHLRDAGVQVQLDREFPESPSVVGRVRGSGGGPTLQLDGHTDTIAVAGPEVRVENGLIYGRGTEDMKGDLAAVAEAVRVILKCGVRLPGDLLITAHGLHETGTNEPLEALIREGIHGDAVIVAEGLGSSLPVVGMGLGIWELVISRDGEPVHENHVPSDTPHPLLAGMRAMDLLRERAAELANTHVEYLGPESVFVGKFQSGDYFNRMPTTCRIAGSRRFGPDRCLEDVREEFECIAETVRAETRTDVELVFSGLESFQVSEDEQIVRVVREAHEAQTGRTLPLSGMRTVGNVSNFVKSARVPAVYYGIGLNTAHSNNEHIRLDEAVQVTKVFIRSILAYFGMDRDGTAKQEVMK